MVDGDLGGKGDMKRRIRRCLGQVSSVRKRLEVQQNWAAARGLISMMLEKT